MFDKFRNLTSYYRNINPSTLSGTCDIIAVDHGSIIRSTPFRARFGKQQVFCLYNHSVTMYVNGKNVNINLKLGNQGEVLFSKDDEKVMKTSSCISPKSENIIFDLKGMNGIKQTKNYGIYENLLKEQDKNGFIRARKEYRKMRLKLQNESIYSRLSRKHKTFQLLLESAEHKNFLFSSTHKLMHVLLALIEQKPLPIVTYSACIKVKLNDGHKDTFDRHKMNILDNPDLLVVHLKCNCSEFFLSFSFFSHLFFLLKSLISTKNTGVTSHFHATVSKLLDIPHIMQTTLTPSHEQFKRMNLNHGRNTIMFRVDGTSKTILTYLYLLRPDTRIVVSDIDGTITRSDAWGHVYNMIGKDWTHSGVAELFDKISKNDYLFLYLSSRPLSQIRYTRKYLAGVKQNGYLLPTGPVLHSPDGLFGAIYREIILRRPEEFKIACLKEVMEIFPLSNFPFSETKSDNTIKNNSFDCSVENSELLINEESASDFLQSEITISDEISNLGNGLKNLLSENIHTPFVAGFGNRKTDIITYKEVGIHRSKIFTIDSAGRIVPEFTNTVSGSYLTLNSIVEKVFPPLKMTAIKKTPTKWWENNKM